MHHQPQPSYAEHVSPTLALVEEFESLVNEELNHATVSRTLIVQGTLYSCIEHLFTAIILFPTSDISRVRIEREYCTPEIITGHKDLFIRMYDYFRKSHLREMVSRSNILNHLPGSMVLESTLLVQTKKWLSSRTMTSNFLTHQHTQKNTMSEMIINGTRIIVDIRVRYLLTSDVIGDPDDPVDGHIAHVAINNLITRRGLYDNMYMIGVKMLAKYSGQLRRILEMSAGTCAIALKVKSLLRLSHSGDVSYHIKLHRPIIGYLSGNTSSRLRFTIGRSLPGHIQLGSGRRYAAAWRIFARERSIREALKVYFGDDVDEEFLDIMECIVPRILPEN